MNDSKAEEGRAWLDFVDEHGAMSVDDRPPIPPINIDDVAEAIREAGGLEEIPALYLLDLLSASDAEVRRMAETLEAERAELLEAERAAAPVIQRAPTDEACRECGAQWVVLSAIGDGRSVDDITAAHDCDGIGVLARWHLRDGKWEAYEIHTEMDADPIEDPPPLAQVGMVFGLGTDPVGDEVRDARDR